MKEYTLLNILISELKIYCGPDEFYGWSKFGQYDEVNNRAPLIKSNKMSNANCTANVQNNPIYGSITIKTSSLCPKSPSARGLVACLPVRLLFKSTKHNAFYPV